MEIYNDDSALPREAICIYVLMSHVASHPKTHLHPPAFKNKINYALAARLRNTNFRGHIKLINFSV